MRKIEITPKAFKQMRKMPMEDRRTVLRAISTLGEWPDCRNVKSLTDREGFRLRVGDYRVLFLVDEATITVTEVRRRDERTY